MFSRHKTTLAVVLCVLWVALAIAVSALQPDPAFNDGQEVCVSDSGRKGIVVNTHDVPVGTYRYLVYHPDGEDLVVADTYDEDELELCQRDVQ